MFPMYPKTHLEDTVFLTDWLKSVAVYSFYNAVSLTENGNSILVSNAQGSLNRISDETGGRTFFKFRCRPFPSTRFSAI